MGYYLILRSIISLIGFFFLTNIEKYFINPDYYYNFLEKSGFTNIKLGTNDYIMINILIVIYIITGIILLSSKKIKTFIESKRKKPEQPS